MEINEQLIEDKLQEALQLHDQGRTYSDIRTHFKEDLNEATISYLIRLVDEFAIEESKIQESIKKAKFKMYVGIAAFVVAVLIVYKFYTNEALQGLNNLIGFLPLIFSFYLMWKGYMEEKAYKKLEPEIDDSKFRMKRRKKASK